MRRLLVLIVAAVAAATAPSTAQFQLQPVAALKGEPALELALRKLDTVGNFMMTTAHPDDENNAMLAYFAHGQGFRTSLVTATHGEGGQNEIGPELFVPLAVLRTEELLAAHRFDGAEQYFTRAIDFGFSFSIEETLEKWGHQEILGDFVRMIRTIRPDVIVGFVFGTDGGGQHHQASTQLTLEAFRAAADPARFPEQITEGLRPWQAAKFYYTAGFGPPPRPSASANATADRSAATTGQGDEAPTALNFAGGDIFDPVLGRTYNEIAGEARSMHKCQGMSQLLPLPVSGGASPMGPGGVRAYRLRDTVLDGGVARSEREIFDGVDTSLRSLLRFAGPQTPSDLGNRLDAIAAWVAQARTALAARGAAASAASIAGGLTAVRDLREVLASLPEDARYEIDFRLAQKERQFEQALLLAADVRLEAIARDGLVPPGHPVAVNLIAAKRGPVPVSAVISVSGLVPGPKDDGQPCSGELGSNAGHVSCARNLMVPADARSTAAHFRMPDSATATAGALLPSRYIFDADVPFGLPFRPTPYTATFRMLIADAPVQMTIPIQARSEADIFSGEKRHEIHVVPAFAVTTTPEIVVVSTNPGTGSREPGTGKDVRVTVTHHASGAAAADVTLELPPGWRATPATQPVKFTREDESITVRFTLQPPPASVLMAAAMKPGGNQFTVKANVTSGGKAFAQGYQVVEYPHTTRRHVLLDPQVNVKALDVRVRPNLTVGYVMGVGDEVPAALEQLGVKPSFMSADELAWGDLSRYHVIVTGVRAYERRADLRANNQRLLDFAAAGGTVIVQYNKLEFNDAQYGPYPARVGRERVTDENAEVRVLAPNHPVFTSPNAIGRADWAGWVQERGLYFLDAQGRDPRYADLVEFTEPFPSNQGVKRGALVEARIGKGRWLYVGLGLWRQLPAGTDGAYRLMANLLSLQ
jgi:LmbE family N-acetylglucosaminyl deacetylase